MAVLPSPTVPEPVSELRANFTLRDRGSGPRVEMSCQASSGSPPITYSLVGKDGQVHLQQRPRHGQPANFSFLPGQTSDWFQCQAANSVNVQHSALTLVPPGEKALGFPEGQLALLCWEGASVQDTGRWEVGRLYPATAESTEGTGGNHAHPGPCLKEAQPSCLRPAPRRVTQGTHHRAGRQPRLHCGRHLRDAGLDHVGQVGNGCWMQGGGRAADGLRGSAGLWLGSSGGGACRAGLWPGQRRAVTAYARLEGIYEDLLCHRPTEAYTFKALSNPGQCSQLPCNGVCWPLGGQSLSSLWGLSRDAAMMTPGDQGGPGAPAFCKNHIGQSFPGGGKSLGPSLPGSPLQSRGFTDM